MTVIGELVVWVVTMEHIAGTEMIADMLTKPLGRVLFVRLLSLLDNYSRDHCAATSASTSAHHAT